MDTVYIERSIAGHPRTERILARYPQARQISIERFGDVFNATAQNFRRQKQRPALILAQKHGRKIIPTPPGYHIGGSHNYYFSHMLNCVYDCRYCFLQGMYRSANHVVFVNTEDFLQEIFSEASRHQAPSWYFSGYDCDSLALDPVTGFVADCLDAFVEHPLAHLELRTKSTQIRPLLGRTPLPNVVVAFSLSPAGIVQQEEHGTPSLAKRLDALQRLQHAGWTIGLRFDPLLYADNFETLYGAFFDEVFSALNMAAVHSVSLGVFRLPKAFHKRMVTLYPQSRLLSANTELRDGQMSYPAAIEAGMRKYCESRLASAIRADQLFPCS